MIKTKLFVLIPLFALLKPALAADAPTVAPTTQNSMGPADVPAPKTGTNGPRFLQMHEKFVKRAQGGNVDLLFLGDSITEGWGKAPDVWKKEYEPLHVANFGIGGDRTQHVLWRIENGELNGIRPKVVVLMIGTNNSASDGADSISKAIEKTVAIIRNETNAKVLLLAIFPREHKGDTRNMETIKSVNEQIAKLDDGKNVRYLDISKGFETSDGKLDHLLFSDGLHPNVKGYQIWADSMRPLLTEMMQ
jgi:beta-glucosidase